MIYHIKFLKNGYDYSWEKFSSKNDKEAIQFALARSQDLGHEIILVYTETLKEIYPG